jgi:hypothetical protein
MSRVRSLMACLCMLVGLLCLIALQRARADDEWRFILPEPGAEHEYPPLRAIPLSNEKPEDVQEQVEYRGASRRDAQLRYGSPSAPRLAIVVDQVAPGEVDLYVNTNRDRTIAADERSTGEGRLWRVPMDVQYARGDEFDVFPRQLIFRLGSTGRTLSYAAAGYLEGKVHVDPVLPDKVGPALRDGNRAVAEGDRESPPRSVGATLPESPPGSVGASVRRMDGDANGFFTDPQDRLWIDLNGDRRWDAVDEQFLYSPILTLGGQTGGICHAGDDLTFQPKLFTVDGLLINTCYRGTHDTGRDGTCASIKLAASDGALLSTAQSGFA